MALDVLDEVTTSSKLLVSGDLATEALSRWTAAGFVNAANEIRLRSKEKKELETIAAPRLAAVLLRSAQCHSGQQWLQQAPGSDGTTNADIILRGCLDEENNVLIRRAAAATLARIVRYTNDERNSNGIVFAYARGLLAILVQLTVSPDEEVASQAQLGTAFVLQMSASMGREIGGLVGAGAAVADELAILAKRANDLQSDMSTSERCRTWKVCVRMADIDNAVGQMLGIQTIQALAKAVHDAAICVEDSKDGIHNRTECAIASLNVLREAAESAKSCAAAAVDSGITGSLARLLEPTLDRRGAEKVRAAALESAAAFVAFIESVEDLRTPLLHALELALADGPCHGDCDSRCGAEAALRGVQVLCKSQEGASMCCSRLGARTVAFAFITNSNPKHQKDALRALAALFTCGNGLPEPLLQCVWDSIAQLGQSSGDAAAGLLALNASVQEGWLLLEAASLHPWAVTDLLQSDKLRMALVRIYTLEEDVDESRKQALQNIAHVLHAHPRILSDGESKQLLDQIPMVL